MENGLGEKLWEPSANRVKNSQMTSFTNFVNKKTKKSLISWKALHDWSVEDLGLFWELLSLYAKVIWQNKPSEIYIPPPNGKMQGASWFKGAHLNYSQNLLEKIDLNTIVLQMYHEDKIQLELTGRELWNRVAALAHNLQRKGLKKGDRVAGILSNTSVAIEAMLAVTSLGGVWSSCSPDFGHHALSERLAILNAKMIFFTPKYFYKDKEYNTLPALELCFEKLSTVDLYICLDNQASKNLKNRSKTVTYNSLLNTDKLETDSATGLLPIHFEALTFMDPLFIMFSSGTTGAPKCIVHGVGGSLLQHKKELMLHVDLKKSDKLMFYTSCSWMMWNWMVSSLSVGASLVLYDGCPSHPNPLTYLEVAKKEKVNVLGTSPNYIAHSKNQKLSALKTQEGLSSLKTILTTGSPLLPEHFKWVYSHLKKDVHLSSISGGTDILSCFLLGNPNLPVYSGEIQVAGLGMKVEGRQQNTTNEEKLELVCTKPFVSMPLFFLNDPKGKKMTESYFNFFPKGDEVWRHGDYIEVSKNSGYVIYGRSDATLNPNGVRIGTSEYYTCLDSISEIKDSLVAPLKSKEGDKIILFVSLTNDIHLSNSLELSIKEKIQSSLTKRHLPWRILQVTSIPETHNGKKVEILVHHILNGKKIENLGSLANPEALNDFKNHAKRIHSLNA